MTIRSNGPAAGFGWLSRGVSAAFDHPKAMFGGAAFLLVAAMLPSLITFPMQLHAVSTATPMSTTTTILMMVFSMLFGLLVLPLYAGYLQLIDAAESGLPVRAVDIFKPYRSGQALPVIGFGLVFMLIYITIIGIIIFATGSGIASWYMQLVAAQASHEQVPALPGGFGITVSLFVLALLFIMGFYSISLGQIALRRRSVIGAIGDGLIGAAKNMLPLFVYAISSIVAAIVLIIVLLIAILLIGIVAKLISVWLMFVLVVPLYIGMVLIILAVSFGVMYHLWRDVCGDNTAISTPPPPPPFAA